LAAALTFKTFVGAIAFGLSSYQTSLSASQPSSAPHRCHAQAHIPAAAGQGLALQAEFSRKRSWKMADRPLRATVPE